MDCDWRVRVNCHIHGTTHLRRWLVTIARLLHGSRYTPWVGSIARTLVPHGQLMPWPITSFILHLTGTSLIRTYQGRLMDLLSSGTQRHPKAGQGHTQGQGPTAVYSPVALWNCGGFNRPPYHRGLIKGMKIHWTVDRAGEICKVQGQLQYQRPLEHFSTAALGKAWLTTLHA